MHNTMSPNTLVFAWLCIFTIFVPLCDKVWTLIIVIFLFCSTDWKDNILESTREHPQLQL